LIAEIGSLPDGVRFRTLLSRRAGEVIESPTISSQNCLRSWVRVWFEDVQREYKVRAGCPVEVLL
jgi:hypothetical protein